MKLHSILLTLFMYVCCLNVQTEANPQNVTRPEVAIVGGIKAPGRYEINLNDQMTLMQLIKKAGGTIEPIEKARISVTRVNDGTKTLERIRINRDKTEIERFKLLPGDVVIVSDPHVE